MRRTPLLAAALMLLSPFPALAQALTPSETEQVDAIVAVALRSTGVPSASIAIVRDGKIVYAKAYGNQGPSFKTPSVDAKYPIASISKQFTAAALLLLEDDGKLSLDDPVSKYVPGITDGDKITIRQLLSHTAGLQDYWPQDYSFAAMEIPTTPQGIVDRWAKKPLDFAPGSQWQYSNTGYVVAGMIIEKVSGMKLMDFLQQRIFTPLDMHPVDQDHAVGKGYPIGTHRFALGPVRPAKPAADGWLWAMGELAMSATDLAKWDIARIKRNVLTPQDWDEQETAIQLTDGNSSRYGLGVFVLNQGGHKVVTHGGEAVGFLSDNSVLPNAGFAVVVLVNADFADAQGTISSGIARLLAPEAPRPAIDTSDEAHRLDMAKAMYAALQKGTVDRTLLTEDARYYFTPQAVADYRDSLAPLGEPSGVSASAPRLRGGFVNRNYTLTYPDRKLRIVTYAEPGRNGRFEQFIVMPAE